MASTNVKTARQRRECREAAAVTRGARACWARRVADADGQRKKVLHAVDSIGVTIGSMPTGYRSVNGIPMNQRDQLLPWLIPVFLVNAVGTRYFASRMSSTYETLAKILRALRSRRQITQEAVAEGSAIPPASISDYENAENKGPAVDRLVALADFYGVSVDYLLGRTECERMPAYGLWLIDKNEERNPRGAGAEWAVDFPASFDIVTEEEYERRREALANRWKNKKGRGNASPES
jgi:transcriptional regulator with XRE-family HTH domain